MNGRGIALAVLLVPAPAFATLGIFEHGNGLQSMGAGGVGYVSAGETTALAANPAHALALGERWDIGVDVFSPVANARYEGNAAGPDARYRTDAKRWWAIPQGGYVTRLSEDVAIGATVLSAGLGPDYPDSPYQRFGSAQRTSLKLGNASLVTALAWRPIPGHALGGSLNVGYQTLAIEGLELVLPLSESPGHVTNQGRDGAFAGGFTLGWRADLASWLSAGAAYRSKNWTQKHREYRGLVAEGGRLELPATYGGGLAVKPATGWTITLEAQRYEYRSSAALRNGIGQIGEGHLFGSDDGPGFGFHDQNAYKLGVEWQVSPALALRAGYIHATQMVDARETLFGFLGCLNVTTHYTAGATWKSGSWEWTGYAFSAPVKDVHGQDSIPAAFGGGEADISNEAFGFGLSIGRRLGR